MHKRAETTAAGLPVARNGLARGDFSFPAWEINEVLNIFRINLGVRLVSEAARWGAQLILDARPVRSTRPSPLSATHLK